MFTILLILIFIRPFICSLAYPCIDFVYFACLMLFLVLWVIHNRFSFKQILPLRYPLLFFSVALTISLFFSQDKVASLHELHKYLGYLILLIIIAGLNAKDWPCLINTILITAVIISILSIYQYFFGFRHVLAYLAKNNITSPFTIDFISRKRVFFPFVSPNALGGYLSMIIPLAFLQPRRLLLLVLLFTALFLTKSLGSILSLFLGLIVYLALKGSLKREKMLLLLGLFIFSILIFILRAMPRNLHTQPFFSTLMRLHYWQDTLKIIGSKLFTGVGIGNFNLTQSRYAHNSYLQIWAEMGAIGIFAFIWIFLQTFRIGFKKFEASMKKDTLLAVLLSSGSIFMIHNAIDFTFFLPEVASIWWILVSLIINISAVNLNPNQEGHVSGTISPESL